MRQPRAKSDSHRRHEIPQNTQIHREEWSNRILQPQPEGKLQSRTHIAQSKSSASEKYEKTKRETTVAGRNLVSAPERHLREPMRDPLTRLSYQIIIDTITKHLGLP